MAKVPEHIAELHRQEQELIREELRNPKEWLALYRELVEDEDLGTLRGLYRATRRLVLAEKLRCEEES